MSQYKLLKQAADQLDHMAELLEKSAAEVAAAKSAAEQAKATATEKPEPSEKVASAEEAERDVRIGELAKTAAEAILGAGLLSDRHQADAFASQIRDPAVALQKLAQLSQHVQAPRMGSVVVDDASEPRETADDVWAKHASAALGSLNLG